MPKKLLHSWGILCFALVMQGCIKDKCTRTYSYFLPVYKTTAEVRANIKSNSPRQVERTGKIFVKGRYIFLNEIDRGIHIIDNISPASPKIVAFIDIPGNMDMAVKGDILYADSFTDLVTLNIADPLNAKLVKVEENVFPFRYYYNGYTVLNDQVVVDWEKRDTTLNAECGDGGFWGTSFKNRQIVFYNDVAGFMAMASSSSYATAASVAPSPFGAGGSMARFSIVGDYLYTVTNSDLNIFSIQQAEHPAFNGREEIGMNIETIYPFKDRLFIGSFNGMYIYNISNGGKPVKESSFSHVASCDPVVADDTHAYVTLRSGNQCQGFTNQMEVLDIVDIKNPVLEKIYPMTNPHGLSKNGDILFVCDGQDGLKVYDASDPLNIKLETTISNIVTFDVIAMHGIAIVVTSEGLYQYSYSSPSDLRFLSKIEIEKS
ncbi:MAG: hypothetical protein KIT80_11435 [Chitinophagaceae bacterium]|nr:hypothetical protein [Chitinophagaceae bacterium]MCW5927514.1 hypothetical protein [Chitinophagaceae bacterium]